MTKKVIIYNGPPESGKDISVRHMLQVCEVMNVPAKQVMMKNTIYEQIKLFYHLTSEQMHYLFFGPESRAIKEKPNELLNGRTPREALIHMSECVTKPNFGKAFYGHAAASEAEGPEIVFCSDGGFPEEIVPMVEKFGFNNVCIVRIYREGCDFSNDSRNYLPDGLCGCYYDIQNEMKFENNQKEFMEFLNKIEFISNQFIRS